MAFKMKGFPQHKGVKSQNKKKVDPDAPGTPGKPGYEPPVKRSDLDAKGKAIWDKHRERKEPTYEGTDEYRPEKDIPKKEFEERGVKKKENSLEKTQVGPRAKKKKVKKEEDNVPLSPGFEDPIKIQKLQREGLVPGSQKFIKKKK